MENWAERKPKQARLAICLLLAMLVWVVFGQTRQYGFVNYDDDAYVYENPIVQNGLTPEGVKEVFTSEMRGIHYPLTMLSFMLDREFQGMEPGGFHLTNVLLHAATAIALFLVLLNMTGALWRSAFVAALFAIHPLRVESVVWITERKDVLSGLFFMLTIAAYLGYARRPFSIARHALVCLFLALGLLAKPMLATTPFVLLLLDFWPLKRWRGEGGCRRILLEKIPLLLLSALSVAMTMGSHAALDPHSDIGSVPILWRVGNALVSYVAYLRQMVWPTGLVPHYPHPGAALPLWQIGGAALLLAVISLTALHQRKNRPWLLVGWLWYLGMLFPVIGITHILGEAARADRFTYLPQIGLYLSLIWLAAEWLARKQVRRAVPIAIATTILAALAATARHQSTHWKNSVSLWNHTLAHTVANALARNNLGLALEDEGKVAEAIRQYEEAIRISPDYPTANNNLGLLLAAQGKTDQAIAHFRRAIRGNPNLAEPRYGLGAALARHGKTAEAIPCFAESIRLDPDLAAPYFGMGAALLAQGKPGEAIPYFELAIQLDPSVAAPHLGLGRAWAMQGKFTKAVPPLQEALRLQPGDPAIRDTLQRVLAAQKKQNLDTADAAYRTGLKMQMEGNFSGAIRQYEQTLQNDPDYYEARNNLAWLLATCPEARLRDGKRAVELAERVARKTGRENAVVLDTLAAAYAEAGRYPEATETARQSEQIQARQRAAPTGIRERIKLYQSGRPYHEPAKTKP